VQRKNPDGLIAAFAQAFGTAKDEAQLVLKSINAHRHPEKAAELRCLTENLNVIWIDEHLEGSRMKQLFATADCYVSLHRSEGLGLGLARAMSYGKPIIATGYSGNMDFTTATNSLLVRYELVELDRDCGVYEKGSFWAEPDIAHAAELMRRVYANREEAAQLGQRAQADLRELMNPATALAQMQQRLGEIDGRLKSL
jgi:glycosyltransferase involved in cell wall biosynthesis